MIDISYNILTFYPAMIDSDYCVSNWEVHLAGNPIFFNLGADFGIYNNLAGQHGINSAIVELAPILVYFYYVAAFWTNHTVPDVLHNMIEMIMFSTELCSLETIPEFFTTMPNLVEWSSSEETGLLNKAGLLPTIFLRMPFLKILSFRACMSDVVQW